MTLVRCAAGSVGAMDLSPWEEPAPSGDARTGLLAWLAFQRHEFQPKWRDLGEERMAAWSAPPLELSALGLVYHIQQMEHAYLG